MADQVRVVSGCGRYEGGDPPMDTGLIVCVSDEHDRVGRGMVTLVDYRGGQVSLTPRRALELAQELVAAAGIAGLRGR